VPVFTDTSAKLITRDTSDLKFRLISDTGKSVFAGDSEVYFRSELINGISCLGDPPRHAFRTIL
jgi:hypothetical protein